jgi:ferric-dicitrate binding protein FerR (iron transport regulator)
MANRDLKLINNADVELAVAWKNGMQAFRSADLKTIMRQVERWYDVDVEFAGNLPVRRFSGEIPRTANLSGLLKLFEATDIHFTIDAEKKKLTVRP